MANKKNQRVNFASVKSPLAYPDFLEVQMKSFKDFLQLDTPPELRKYDGLYKVFSENFPINDTRNNFNLEFLDYFIGICPDVIPINSITREFIGGSCFNV